MNIKNRILLAQAPLGLILIAVGFFFIFALNNLGLNTNDILTSNYRSVAALENMRIAIDKLEWTAKRYDQNIISKQFFDSKMPLYQSDFERNLQIQSENITISGEVESTAELQKEWKDITGKLSKVTKKTLVINSITNELVSVKEKIDLLIQINQDDSFFKSQNIITMINSFISLTFTFATAGFFIGLLITIFIINKILQPLVMLNKAVKAIGDGDIDVKVDVSGADEITELAGEFNEMIKSLEEYRSSSSGKIIKAKIFLQAALDTIPDPMLIISKDYEIENFNEKAVDIFNLKLDKKQNLHDVLPEDIFEGLSIKIRKSFVGELEAKSLKPIFLKISGDKYVEYFPLIRSIDQTGIGVKSVCVVFRNVTDVDLEGYLKTEKIISAMHELLMPLESIQIGLHIGLEEKIGQINAEQQRIFGIAQKSCLDLRRMVVNMIESDAESLLLKGDNTDASNIDEILKNILSDFELIVENKRLNLVVDIAHTFGSIATNTDAIGSILKSVCFAIFDMSLEESKVSIRLLEKNKSIQVYFDPESIKLTLPEITKTLDTNYKNRNKVQQAIFNANSALERSKGKLEIYNDEESSHTKFIIIFNKSDH